MAFSGVRLVMPYWVLCDLSCCEMFSVRLIFIDLFESWPVEMFVEKCAGSQGSGREVPTLCFLSGIFIEMCGGLSMECLKPSVFDGFWVCF